ncbi:MAG: hypothetical protein Q8Q41_02905 [bacterium]|nr:hypothetical protein [bacterium]
MNETSPNLLSHSRTNEAEVDRSLIKIVVLGTLGVLGALATGYFLSRYGATAAPLDFWLLSAAVSMFLVAVLLQTFFVKSLAKAAALDALCGVALLVPLYKTLSPLAFLGVGLAAACILWGNFLGTRELKDRVKIRFFRVSRLALGKTVTGLALFLTLYYLSTQAGGVLVSKPLFEQLLLPVAGVTERFFSGVSLTDTFRDAMTELATNQTKTLPGFELLPPVTQRELVNRAASELEAQASRLLGIVTRSDARLVDLLYESLVTKLADLGEQGKRLALLAAGALIFLTIRGLGVFFVWAAMGIGFVAFEILIALGFATVVLEEGRREIIVL